MSATFGIDAGRVNMAFGQTCLLATCPGVQPALPVTPGYGKE